MTKSSDCLEEDYRWMAFLTCFHQRSLILNGDVGWHYILLLTPSLFLTELGGVVWGRPPNRGPMRQQKWPVKCIWHISVRYRHMGCRFLQQTKYSRGYSQYNIQSIKGQYNSFLWPLYESFTFRLESDGVRIGPQCPLIVVKRRGPQCSLIVLHGIGPQGSPTVMHGY